MTVLEMLTILDLNLTKDLTVRGRLHLRPNQFFQLSHLKIGTPGELVDNPSIIKWALQYGQTDEHSVLSFTPLLRSMLKVFLLLRGQE